MLGASWSVRGDRAAKDPRPGIPVGSTGAVCWGVNGRVSQVPQAQDVGAFVFGQASPDSVGFAGGQGPGRAVADHGAVPADLFGLADPRGLVAAAFAVRVVEDLDVQAAAGGEQLPVPVVGHRPGGSVGHGGHRGRLSGFSGEARPGVAEGPGTTGARRVGGRWMRPATGRATLRPEQTGVRVGASRRSRAGYFMPARTLATMLSTSS